ncbi:unnamed protein product, partial [Gongylonema pulchrum]|uniref:Nucleotidyltransferase n=1 Tax=Gongylonema pulchrum TaxID=637853 RepID=A0A183ENC2_9BILA
MDLLIAVNDDREIIEKQQQQKEHFQRLPESDQQNIYETTLLHCAAFYGLEGLPPQKIASDAGGRTYILMDSVPVKRLIAVCQKAIKLDLVMIAEDLRRRNQLYYRAQTQDPAITKLVTELDAQAANWDNTKRSN